MTTTIFSLIGIAIGASLQYLFSQYLDHQRHQRELKATAYTDYLYCVSEYANLGLKLQSADVADLATRTADAKCRVCLYGSSKLILAFARFEDLGATMNTKEQQEAFSNLVAEMRLDPGNKAAASLSQLQTILLGSDRDKA